MRGRFMLSSMESGSLMERDVIVIVSGLARSGTSMMMRILEDGGLEVLTDGVRKGDEDNPEGYYELESVKRLAEDQSCLRAGGGKAIKIISSLLQHLLAEYYYRVIFMDRSMDEIIASQRKMLVNRGEPARVENEERVASLFRQHLVQVKGWLEAQPHIDVICVDYNKMVEDPRKHIERVNRFLGGRMNVEMMVNAVDIALYRQRK